MPGDTPARSIPSALEIAIGSLTDLDDRCGRLLDRCDELEAAGADQISITELRRILGAEV